MKVMSSVDDEQVLRIQSEYELLRSLDHPGVVRLMEFHKESTDTMWNALIVMEFAGCSLREYLREHILPEGTARLYTKQLLCAFHYIHSRGILHRDVHDGNILVSPAKEQVKLCDFGCSRQAHPGMILSPCGAPTHRAPELAGPVLLEE